MRTCKKGHKYEATRDENGRLNYCPTCRKETLQAYHQNRKHTAEYIEKHRAGMAKWYKKHGSSADKRLAQRGNRLKSLYWPHLTGWEALREYETMLANQDYACRICQVDQSEYDSPFHVDHCHTTGKVRGLLCGVCNRYVVGGIDHRAKAKKVHISKPQLLQNIIKYFSELDPEYIEFLAAREAEKNA